MTWSIRIYPLEREAFLDALAEYEVIGTDAEVKQADSAAQIVHDLLNAEFSDDQLFECSLSGTTLPEAASLSINVYRRRAETQQPQPAESEETATEEVTEEVTESPPEETAAEE